MHFQGRPCAVEQLGAVRTGSAGSERRLRDWLDELPVTEAPAAPAVADRAPQATGNYRPPPLPRRPSTQQSLAQCSEQFLQCAGSDDALMDRCVAEIPRCPGDRAPDCCAGSFIDRYQRLREYGSDRKSAVSTALLGPK